MKIKCALVAIVAIVLFTLAATGQETVTIPLADLQQLRRLAADRDHWKGIAEDREAQLAESNKSVFRWKGLFESEKERADRIQESRITAVKDAVASLERANFELHNQSDDLKRENRDLKDDNIRLRNSRKWYFTAGAAIGSAGGFYAGWQLGKGNVRIPTFGESLHQTQARSIGVKFRF